MEYSNLQILSRSDIADCMASFENCDFAGVEQKSIGLAGKLRKISSSLRKKGNITVQDDACLFFIHEMNNLLSPVVGYAQLLCMGPADAGRSPWEIREMIGEHLEICSQFVDVFLGVRQSRHEDASYCIEDMLRRTMGMTAYFGSTQNIEFAVPDERHYVLMDFVTFFQIALNIIKNAERAGSRNIYIASSCPEPGHIRVDFANDGEMLKPELADAVFRKGFTTKKDGSGIGLAACRAYAEAAKGTMGVDLSSGKTDFYMNLPTAPEKKYLGEMVIG